MDDKQVEVYKSKSPSILPEADLLFEYLTTGILTFEMIYTKRVNELSAIDSISVITSLPLRDIQHD